MDNIVTQLATLTIDRLTQWAFCLTPVARPNYHLYSAFLLMTDS